MPEARIKSAWKAEKLNKTIQLTISGCLGPCDVANVVQIVRLKGQTGLDGSATTRITTPLVEWARACHASKTLVPIPGLSARFDSGIRGRKASTDPKTKVCEKLAP